MRDNISLWWTLIVKVYINPCCEFNDVGLLDTIYSFVSSNHALSFRLRTNSLIDSISLSKWKVKEVGKRAISLCSNSQSLLAFVVKVSWLFFCLPNFQFDGRRSIISSYPFVFDIIVSMAFPLRSKSWMTPHLGFAYTPKRPIHQSDISYLHIISTCERMSLGNICLVFSCVKACMGNRTSFAFQKAFFSKFVSAGFR